MLCEPAIQSSVKRVFDLRKIMANSRTRIAQIEQGWVVTLGVDIRFWIMTLFW